MKTRNLILIIFVILLLILAIIGATFAFYNATTNALVETPGSKLAVIYTGGTTIEGPINLSTSKVEESSTTVNIKLAEGSVNAHAFLYFDVKEISESIAVAAFNWEVYGYQNNNEIYSNKGTFDGINSTTNNIINIVENYPLSETNTQFKVYIWLDGNKVGNEVINAKFRAHIGANTENITADFE